MAIFSLFLSPRLRMACLLSTFLLIFNLPQKKHVSPTWIQYDPIISGWHPVTCSNGRRDLRIFSEKKNTRRAVPRCPERCHGRKNHPGKDRKIIILQPPYASKFYNSGFRGCVFFWCNIWCFKEVDISTNQESLWTFDGEDKTPTSWVIPLAKQVISLVISGISRVSPLITRVITFMSHQVNYGPFMLT